MAKVSNWLSGHWKHLTVDNENQDYIKIKFKSFSNTDNVEYMDCPRIENETLVFPQSCEISIYAIKQRAHLNI